jgi:hypothetical protein
MRNALASLAGCLARFLAFVFAVLFVITAILSLLVFNAGRQITDPGLYKRILVEQRLYARLPRLVAEQAIFLGTYQPCVENPQDPRCLAEGSPGEDEPSEQGGPPSFFLNLDQEDYEVIVSDLLPPEWLQTQIESAIDQAFAIFRSNGAPSEAPAEAVIKIPLKDLKARLTGEAGLHAFLQILRTQQPCSQEQLATLVQLSATSVFSTEGLTPCRPPPALEGELTPIIAAVLEEMARQMPAEATIDLSNLGSQTSEGNQPAAAEPGLFDNPRQAFRMVRLVASLSPLLPVGLILLVTLFGVRSLKGWLLWWGIPFLIAGLVTLGLALSALPALNLAIANLLSAGKLEMSGLSPAMLQAGLDAGREGVRSISLPIEIEAALLAAAGLVMIAISFFARVDKSEVES